MRWLSGPLGGHLGTTVSPLVDGQLDAEAAERAWGHALGCPVCRAAVEREVWVKQSLAAMSGAEPSQGLTAALHELSWRPAELDRASSWSAVADLERRHRLRRGGLLAVGAGTVSAAVIGLGAVSGALDVVPRIPTETSIGGSPQAP